MKNYSLVLCSEWTEHRPTFLNPSKCSPTLFLELFIHCLREQNLSFVMYGRSGIIHNFLALVSLDVDKDVGSTQSAYRALFQWENDLPIGQVPIFMDSSEVSLSSAPGSTPIATLHCPLHKPSLCKARHRVKICFLQMEKIHGTTSFMACGRNSKLSVAFFGPISLSLRSSPENVNGSFH